MAAKWDPNWSAGQHGDPWEPFLMAAKWDPNWSVGQHGDPWEPYMMAAKWDPNWGAGQHGNPWEPHMMAANWAPIETVSVGGRSARPARLAFTPSGGGDMEMQKAYLKYNLMTSSVCLRHN